MNKINSNFDGQTIFVGMDVHKSSWNLGIHLNDMFIKNVHQKPNPIVMANYLKQHFPGAHYKAAYEAGKFGFCLPVRSGGDTTAANSFRYRMPGGKSC